MGSSFTSRTDLDAIGLDYKMKSCGFVFFLVVREIHALVWNEIKAPVSGWNTRVEYR